jgi:hypothetical protein
LIVLRNVLFIATIFAAACVLHQGALGQSDVRPTPLHPIDDARTEAAGIRKLAGRNLALYTDLAADPEVDRLPAVFDAAVPQWAAYFGVNEAKARDWQARAFLIKDRQRFDALGLMPRPGPDQFPNGISINSEMWLYEQPTVYYRRHLLLHEGTHAFMVAFLGSCGPGWFMEGTAELLATHRLDAAGRLTLGVMPQDRDEVPMLGRIKLIRDAVAAGHPLDLPAVMRIDNWRQLENESYAWSWAAARFLDSHPRYRERFRGLQRHVADRRFNEITVREFGPDWPRIQNEWRAFVATLDHGFDFERMAIDFQPVRPLAPGRPHTVTIRTDRGWQSTGLHLDPGRKYAIAAAGRFQINEETLLGGRRQPWICEPGGVTIEYYSGQPLGLLLGAVEDQIADNERRAGHFGDPFAVGLSKLLVPEEGGTLYLRLNDSPGRLDDNRGMVTVTIEAK